MPPSDLHLSDLLAPLAEAPGFTEAIAAASKGKSSQLSQVNPAAWGAIAACLTEQARPGQRVWLIAPEIKTQERIHAELPSWSQRAVFLPELGFSPGEAIIPDPESTAERLHVFHQLAADSDDPDTASGGNSRLPVVVLGSSLDEDVPAPKSMHDRERSLRQGEDFSPEDFVALLEKAGYERVAIVAERGTFALRGGILDVYSWHSPAPVRFEYFDTEIDSIRRFDVDSQTSITTLEEATVLLDRSSRDTDFCKLHEYIRKGDLIVVFGDPEEFPDRTYLHVTAAGAGDDTPTACYESPVGSFAAGDFIVQEAARKVFFDQLREWRHSGWKVTMVFHTSGERTRFQELLEGHEDAAEALGMATGKLARGFTVPAAKLAVLADAEIFGRYQHQRARRAFSKERTLAARRDGSTTDFKEGDFVVHLDYGIGRYEGLRRAEDAEEQESAEDTLVIEFAEKAKLYVPVQQSHLIARYVGTSKSGPPLSKLGDGKWSRARKKAERAVEDYAGQLLGIHAERETLEGHAHEPDGKWQYEFEDAFHYKETPDQLRSIAETKADMESKKPMDRLICGDVGFGKTEIAIRAAFKAIMGGKQVAFLCPTTVLAQQHFDNLKERFSDYPITIELLCRFRTAAQQRKAVKGLHDGSVDIAIGTHRLVSKDIGYKDLGLVIIDEEQRFGVKHKEKFKDLFRLTDVLTLSATPIPRTLYLSLMGARDMSTIETAPVNRTPVATSVCAYDTGLIKRAIEAELKRGGQVFFLHNRVKTIERTANIIRELVPEARVIVGHGQMEDGVLEEVMHTFVEHRADVLLSTTIIESGVDIPNANTILIDRADRFGLADLYQLRGRVGRAGAKAYAYLLVPKDMMAEGDARKRINAIKQYSALGSGFKIAMRDLEIRGAGNLLGTQQHGHINAVGFEIYCKLLRTAVARLQGNKAKGAGVGIRGDVAMRLDYVSTSETAFIREPEGVLPAFLPARYITNPELRVSAYRDLAETSSLKEVRALGKAWKDRFGKPPACVENLLLVSEIRVTAARVGITVVEVLKGKLMLTRNGDTILIGNRFPRLTTTAPTEQLEETYDMVRSL